jgi:hypothetical protein
MTRTDGPNTHILRDVLIFWAMQIGILTPPVFVLFVMAVARAFKRGWWGHQENWNFVAAFFLPLFFVFARASFKTNVHVNWTAPAYLALLLAAASRLAEGAVSRLSFWRWSCAAMPGVALIASVFLLVSLASGAPRLLAYSHSGGWKELGDVVEAAEHALEARTHQKVFTIGVDKYDLAAELGFYTREPDEQVNTYALGEQGLGYRYWTDLNKYEGHPMIAVFNKVDGHALETLDCGFDHTDNPRLVEVSAGDHRTRTFYIVACYGFHAPRAANAPARRPI